MIPNDFVGIPFQFIVGARMPSAHPHGRANPQGAQTLLRQRPQKGTPFCKELHRIPASFVAGGPAPTASLCPAAAAFPPRIPCLDV